MTFEQADRRDLIAGGLLTALGAFVSIYAASNYKMGTATRMGPGYFPVVLGCILAVLGALIFVIALKPQIHKLHPPEFNPKSFIFVSLAVLIFSLLLEKFGILPATISATFVAVGAERPFKWIRTLNLSVCLSFIVWLIFKAGLNMPLETFIF